MGFGPLRGVRVVDFTHVLAGPFSTQLLADAGADVVKVEPPAGEYARVRGPVRVGADGTEVSSYHAAINRGKRSISLDLKTRAGVELAQQFIADADVVVENFAPGALLRLGVDFAGLRERYPRLITASVSLYGGFEAAGALAERPGLAVVAEAESTVTGMTRDAGKRPVFLAIPLGDMATGLATYGAITTALFERERTGRGQHLDVSMVRTLMALNSCGITGQQIDVGDIADVRMAAYNIFATSDGFVAIGCNSDAIFARLCAAMGKPELARDPRYATYQEREQRIAEVDGVVTEWAVGLSSTDVVEVLTAHRVPCGNVRTPANALADQRLRELGFFKSVSDGLGGTLDTASNPFRWEQTDSAIPRLDEHGRELIAELGIDGDGYDKLAAEGAFGSLAGR